MKDVKPINERLDVVDYFFREPDFREAIDEQFHRIGDLERIISKVAVGRVSPREVVQLKERPKGHTTCENSMSLCQRVSLLNALENS